MLDFLKIFTRIPKKGVLEIYPNFVIKKSNDLMIRGSDFYAIWVEERGLWSTEEEDALQLIDQALDTYAKEHTFESFDTVRVLHMWDSSSHMIDAWHKYCQKQMRDNFHMLDEKLIFSNSSVKKKDYASKRLSYPLEACETPAYEKLMSTLYSPEERKKLEWAIGAIVSGDSKTIQKFEVLYGAAGTGKSTVLNIIQQLFEGYYCVFDAKALGSANSAFALEAFKTNPLVAIQHDGDLSRIEDNTRLNSLTSHELMTVNEKFKSQYANRFKCFVFMGTNKPVRITDAKSGLIRRLIDVKPSGNKLKVQEYKEAVDQIKFELGGIAQHCLDVYEDDPGAYDDYIPTAMFGASNDFFNFVSDSYLDFDKQQNVSLNYAWDLYKKYCEDAKVTYPYPKRSFKEELKNYFKEFHERYYAEDGSRIRNYYVGFNFDKFENGMNKPEESVATDIPDWLDLKEQPSKFDIAMAGWPAQYANDAGTPMKKWANVKTFLRDIDTHKLHYFKGPENLVTIDFDIPDENGNKCFEKNVVEARKWPKTYAELSKGGQGIHLEYIWDGTTDLSEISSLYSEHIEIKLQIGNSSLRRKLTKCNDLGIAILKSGLPLKGKKTINKGDKEIKSVVGLRSLIARNLRKEIHGYTSPSVKFIKDILDEQYARGDFSYDVSDMQKAITEFAEFSTNHADECLALVDQMHFRSKDVEEKLKRAQEDFEDICDGKTRMIAFFDIEIYPNLMVLCWMLDDPDGPVIAEINPSPEAVREFFETYAAIGFNNLRYDNPICYARGYLEEPIPQLYEMSRTIIGGDTSIIPRESRGMSYCDVFDMASAGNKMSLKKLEIKMGEHHQEMNIPWDQPAPEELWDKIAEYCKNDVRATRAAFHYLSSDFMSREILSTWAHKPVNTTTNNLTTAIIFQGERHPQSQFQYRDLSKPVFELPEEMIHDLTEWFPEMMAERHGPEHSLLPYFPGYRFYWDQKRKKYISIYRGEEAGEGGFVYNECGIWGNVALLDITSMHPHSMITEWLFGIFTRRLRNIVEGRVSIKHEDYELAKKLIGGDDGGKWLDIYIDKIKAGEITSKDLANALKTAINSVYGLTAAHFDNPFHDPRNKDNIVAKRGALFMIDLKAAVQEQGFKVCHIKTDSIKIPDATPEIIQFVMDFGKRYGYSFEHEATYDRMCLVNGSTYIARYATPEKCEQLYGYAPKENREAYESEKKKPLRGWTATAKEFAVPYVFKTLFSHEPITFEDHCYTFETKSNLYLDMNESLQDVTAEEKELAKLEKKMKELDGAPSDDMVARQTQLNEAINANHDLQFVGRVGQFVPVKSGEGGGVLYQVKDGSRSAAPGTKGYRWLDSELVRHLESEKQNDIIDQSYGQTLADEAKKDIFLYGDYEWFVSDDPYIPPEYADGKPVYKDYVELK